MDLDQAFQRFATLQKGNAPKSKIISKSGFLCEPTQDVDIKRVTPNLVEFSEDIDLTSDIVVISLALFLKRSIGNNKTTTCLYMSHEPPKILRRIIQLLLRYDETVSYTESVQVYLRNNTKSKMIFASNFQSVNGMEFDHVVIFVSQSNKLLKYYLHQVISRCTYDLTFVMLPKEKEDRKRWLINKMKKNFLRTIKNT